MPAYNLIQNIVGGDRKSDSRIVNLSECINMYVETNGSGASSSQILRSIQGTSDLIDLETDGICRGLFVPSKTYTGNIDTIIGVFGDKVYVVRLFEGVYQKTIIGYVNSSTEPVSICETGGEGSAHPHICIVDGSSLYAFDSTLEEGEMINDFRSIQLPYRVVQPDPNNPSIRIQPTHLCYCKNYLLINDSGTDAFYTSYEFPFERTNDLNQIDYDIFMVESTQYKDYGFITYAEWSPDNITAMATNGTYLYTFGPKSTQLFTGNNDVDAPFISPTNCANGIGIKATKSLASIGDYLFFLGSSDIGENGLYYWQGNQIIRFSNPDIEREISNYSNPSDAIGQCWQENGHLFYSITFIQDDTTFVYDIAEQEFHKRSTKDALTNKHHYWRPLFAHLYTNKLCFGTNDGHIIYLNPDKYTEYDNRPIIRIRRSGAVMTNYQHFIVDSVELICNNGDFSDIELSKALLNPKIMMRYSDKGSEWSNQEMALLGKEGEYDYNCLWYNLGLHKIMNIEFSCSDPVNFIIVNGTIRYSIIDM